MTKIQLSAEEMQLVKDPSWILTKHRVIAKVYELFGSLADQMQATLLAQQAVLPAEVLSLPPKISKGEQYEALPYVVLDYPRIFSKQDVFAIRSFFWWGNYFSITWHLKGKYLQMYAGSLAAALHELPWAGYVLSTSGNEFSFNLEGKNYVPLASMPPQFHEGISEAPFLKLSFKIPFDQWMEAEEKMLNAFKAFLSLAKV